MSRLLISTNEPPWLSRASDAATKPVDVSVLSTTSAPPCGNSSAQKSSSHQLQEPAQRNGTHGRWPAL
jgi:hypothetical protein